MGPAGKFLSIRQGDRSIEEYAEDFLGMAHQSATDKTCLMIIFWGGLANPFKSMMPYWAPEALLEDYINLALNLTGSAFRVESAPKPAPFHEPRESAPEPTPFRGPTQSAPEPAPFREPEKSAPEPAPFRELGESAPEPAPFRELGESAPEPAPFRELGESAPEPAPFRELEESAPEPAPFREATQSAPEPAPFREATQSTPEPAPFLEPMESAHNPPALPAPPWHPWLPLPQGPLPLHGPGPPHPSPYSAPALPFPFVGRLGTSGSRSLKGGLCHESRPAFLPLTTRGRHLSSSWTHFSFIPHTCH